MTANTSLGLSFMLPFPLSTLSPNTRAHRTAIGAEKAVYRHRAMIEAKQARIRADVYVGDVQEYLGANGGKIPITITFCPRREMDDDNIIASFKAGRDGVADGLGVDDKVFTVTYQFAQPNKKAWVKVEV